MRFRALALLLVLFSVAGSAGHAATDSFTGKLEKLRERFTEIGADLLAHISARTLSDDDKTRLYVISFVATGATGQVDSVQRIRATWLSVSTQNKPELRKLFEAQCEDAVRSLVIKKDFLTKIRPYIKNPALLEDVGKLRVVMADLEALLAESYIKQVPDTPMREQPSHAP